MFDITQTIQGEIKMHVKKFTLIEKLTSSQSLIKSYVSVASTNNISNTMWDASPTRD